jgi:hypothetical protein
LKQKQEKIKNSSIEENKRIYLNVSKDEIYDAKNWGQLGTKIKNYGMLRIKII